MIYTELTKKAMKLAYDAHNGQTDKSGMPVKLQNLSLFLLKLCIKIYAQILSVQVLNYILVHM